jgi:hypothetical protein
VTFQNSNDTGLKVALTKFILSVKLFILEVPVNKAYKELELAYNTYPQDGQQDQAVHI